MREMKISRRNVVYIALVTITAFLLHEIGVIDAEIGARERSGVSIYLCPPFTTYHLIWGLFVWSCLACFICKRIVVDAARRAFRRTSYIRLLFFTTFPLLLLIVIDQNRSAWLSRRFYSNTRIPTPNVQVLIFDAHVGRMANLMINYLWLSIRSRRTGMQMRVIKNTPVGALSRFPNVHYNRLEFGGVLDILLNVTASDPACGEYYQNYLYFQNHRQLAARLFDLTNVEGSLPRLGPDDVVIHFRFLEEYRSGHADPDYYFPPYSYFAAILDVEAPANKSITSRTVWIVAEPAQRAHFVVQHLVEVLGARIVGANAEEELLLAIRAPIFIGSQGTFSWMATYLFRGRSAHVPFIGPEASGSIWTPHCDLFIHDDARLRYYDLKNLAAGGRTAAQLLAGASGPHGSAFARCAAARGVDPKCMP